MTFRIGWHPASQFPFEDGTSTVMPSRTIFGQQSETPAHANRNLEPEPSGRPDDLSTGSSARCLRIGRRLALNQ
jgi:hypothetical protein